MQKNNTKQRKKPIMSLMQRDMAYKAEMREWLLSHPTATAEEITKAYRDCAKKWNV